MPKNLIFTISLAVIVITAYFTWVFNSGSTSVSKTEVDTAINQARYLFQIKKLSGNDLSDGKCLSDALLPGWAVDIVHHPRISIDDLPENQCPSYREGRAKHIVELDIDGKLIKAE